MDNSLYGRKWELKFQCYDGTFVTVGNDGISGVESLKCTFDVNYPGYEGWYFSEFNIWNPTPETSLKLVKEGARVFLSAGYSKGNYGPIFGGSVFQSFFTRENVVDYKLTLLCIDGERLFKDNFTSFNLNAGYTAQAVLNIIASKSQSPISMGKITDYLKEEESIRGMTAFAGPDSLMREQMRTNNTHMYAKDDKVEICHMSDLPQGDAIEVSPKTGLIGTPQQIEYGISFRMLLHPDMMIANPPKWCRLDLSQISVKPQKAIPGQALVPVLLSAEEAPYGYFKIGGVRHSGDTRGNDWYTDVIGYSLTGKSGLQMAVPTMFEKPTYAP